MIFNDYLNTEVGNSTVIFEYYLNFLKELSSQGFPYEEQLTLKGMALKFINCVEYVTYVVKEDKEKYLNQISLFIDELRVYRRYSDRIGIILIFYPFKKRSLHRVQDSFADIFTVTVDFINAAARMNRFSNNLELNGFYKPENSNKKKIKDLINEAIELLNEDMTLSEKSKKQIVKYLNKALQDLEREHVNWSMFIGRIKETIIVLGALGTIASSVSVVSPLLQIQEKLEETNAIIQTESVNINVNILTETFNVQNIEKFAPYISAVLPLEGNHVALEN